jgi:hypothetical protein
LIDARSPNVKCEQAANEKRSVGLFQSAWRRSKSLASMNPPIAVAALTFHCDAPYASLFSESDLVYSIKRFVQIRSLLANHDSSPRPVFGQVAVIQGSD